MNFTVAIGRDHAGHRVQITVIAAVEAPDHLPLVVSADSAEPTDCPDVVAALTATRTTGRSQRRALICGSGRGHGFGQHVPPPPSRPHPRETAWEGLLGSIRVILPDLD